MNLRVEENRFVTDSLGKTDPHFFNVQSMSYNYFVVGRGVVLNPEVSQMLTPAGLRSEHPIATLLGWSLGYRPDFEGVSRLNSHLATMQGAFCFIAISADGQRAVACVKNLDTEWSDKHQRFVKTTGGKLVNCSWLLALDAGVRQETISVPISSYTASRRLFVLDSFKDDWSVPYRSVHDYRVTSAQIDYKHVRTHLDKGKSGPWHFNFVSRCLAFALEFPVEDVPGAIVLGLKPKDCDLLLLSALTRVVFASTTGHIKLEVPLYERAIGYPITAVN